MWAGVQEAWRSHADPPCAGMSPAAPSVSMPYVFSGKPQTRQSVTPLQYPPAFPAHRAVSPVSVYRWPCWPSQEAGISAFLASFVLPCRAHWRLVSFQSIPYLLAQEAGVKIFLNCGICLLSVIALLLADAALVVYVFRKKGWS